MNYNFPSYNSETLYLDSASSALMCQEAIDAEREYNETYPVNVHRGMYAMAQQADTAFTAARETVASYIGSTSEEVIFTSGTTQSLNMAAQMLSALIKNGTVVVSGSEHHANLIPWQQYAKTVSIIPADKNGDLAYDQLASIITEETTVVAVTLMSNVTGTITDIAQIVKRAKEVGAIVVADAAQFAALGNFDVHALGVDMLAFSGHKVYGPTGIGVLYISTSLQSQLEPVVFGGDMVDYVSYKTARWSSGASKFEAGTPNISGAIGLAAALNMVMKANHTYTDIREAFHIAMQPHVEIIESVEASKRGPIIAFTMNDLHPHDIAEFLSTMNIAVRSGQHCAMPLMQIMSKPGVVRVSLGIYSQAEDAQVLGQALEKIKQIGAYAKSSARFHNSPLHKHYTDST